MDEGHVNVYGNSGDYMQVALHALMNSVCNYLECPPTTTAPISEKSMDVDEVFQDKLDQAADSIKKHLLCSVRKDMEEMKGKLSDLEVKIDRLEVENTLLLREYVPADILERRMSETLDDPEISKWVATMYRCSCAFDQQQLSVDDDQHDITHISVTAADPAKVAPLESRAENGTHSLSTAQGTV